MSRLYFLVLAASLTLASRPASAQKADTLRLSIEEAVAAALRSSDEVRLAATAVDVADAQVGSARSSALPHLRLNTTYTHTYESARGQAVGQLFNQPNTYGANLQVTQSIFQGGRIISAWRAAADVRAASRFDEHETKAIVALNVQRAYLQVLFSSRLEEIQTNNLTLASSRQTQVEQLQAAGRAARYDVLRSRVERANIEPLVIQARNDRELAELELKRLINVPVSQPLALTTTVDANGVRTMLASLSDSTVVPDRASIRAAEATSRARHAGISIARADFLPTASITFNTGYSAFPPRNFGFPNRMGQASNAFCPEGSSASQVCQNGGWFSDRSLSAVISIPIFDGFRAKSSLDLARAQARFADAELQQERERVALEVARARAELERARALFEARQQTSAEAQEAFQLASLRFSRGLSTQLEVSDAQLALLTAASVEARATFDLYLASAELARSLGRPIPLPPTVQLQPTRRSEDGIQREH